MKRPVDGWPPRRTGRGLGPAFPPTELVRVTLLLDRQALEDLDLLVRARFGPSTRSALVRDAISWLRARESASLVRLRAREERQRRRAEEDARALALSREERDRVDAHQQLEAALAIARDITTGVVE